MADADVSIDIKGNSNSVERALTRVSSSVKKFASVANIAFASIAAGLLIRQIGRIGRALFDLYSTQEQAEVRLAAVVKATGQAAGFTADEFKKMASRMQEELGIGDEVLLQAMAIAATFKNIKGDQFEETIRVAADMAAVLQGDVTQSIMQVSKAMNDPIKGVSALAEAGVSFTEQQKEMIKSLTESGDIVAAQKMILAELKSEFEGTAEALSNTFTGRVTRATNKIGDLGEKIFQFLVPALEGLAELSGPLITFFDNLIDRNEEYGGELADGVKKWTDTIKKWASDLVGISIVAYTEVEFALEAFVMKGVKQYFKFNLAFLEVMGSISHWLTEVLPARLIWLSTQWSNIFTDIAEGVSKILENMFKNVEEFWDVLKRKLKGEDVDWEFTGLLEGFESSLDKLPEIAERKLTPKELGLKAAITAITGAEALLPDMKSAEIDRRIAEFWDLFREKRDEEADEGDSDNPRLKSKSKRPAGEFKATTESLEALNKRISLAALSPAEEAMKKLGEMQVENGKKAVDKLDEVVKEQKKNLKEQKETNKKIEKVGALK